MRAVSLALRYLWLHRRLNLVVLAVLAFTVSLLAALPTYATVIAMRSLRASLTDAPPAVRSLTITADQGFRPNPALMGELTGPVNDLVTGRMDLYGTRLEAGGGYELEGGIRLQILRLAAMSRMRERLVLVEGRLPEHWEPQTARERLIPPRAEALVAATVAADFGIQVGDTVTSTGENVFTVVGLIQPADPAADLWFGDLSLFETGLQALDANTDIAILPLILPLQSMQQYFAFHAAETRIQLDHERITVNSVEALRGVIGEIQNRGSRQGVRLSTGLGNLIDLYARNQARVQVTLFLLTAQATAFALYTLAMMAQFLQAGSAQELGTMMGRGASRMQTTLLLSLAFLLLVLPVVALGPLLGRGALILLLRDAALVLPERAPVASWWVAAAAGGAAWVVLTVTAYAGSRSSRLETERARPAGQVAWQRVHVDFLLLVLGGLTYWQLRQSGGFVIPMINLSVRGGESDAPLLLLGPSLLLIAVAMLFLRIFPLLLRWIARLTGWSRGLVLPLGIARLARDPARPSQVVLLISLATGLTLFAQTFTATLTARQAEMAHYLAGADLRLRVETMALQGEEPDVVLAALDVAAESRVFQAQAWVPGYGTLTLLAVDRTTFAQVARFPGELTAHTVGGWMGVLNPLPTAASGQEDKTDVLIPAIVSHQTLPPSYVQGAPLTVALRGYRLPLQVRGIAVNFPTLSGAFAVVDLETLLRVVEVDRLHQLGDQEVWLELRPDQLPDDVAARAHELGRLAPVTSAAVKLRLLQSDAATQSAVGAFRLNAAALTLLSLVAFLMVHTFAAQQRGYELSILRAGGASPRQLLSLLSAEGVLVTLLGLGSGTLIGLGLAAAMLPAMAHLVSASLAGASLGRVVMAWPALVALYGLLAGGYALAQLVLLGMLWRAGVHRALRIGEM
jgi:putative ABC transport system permease protein